MLNAILIRDFRIYSRNRRYFSISILYIIILCATVFGMLWFADTSKKPLNPEYGSSVFSVLIIAISLAIYSISPAFAVNIMSSEKQSLDLIKPTLIRNHQIISSKILTLATYILILILLSSPIMLLAMPIGGFTLTNMLDCYLVIFVSALAFGIMGIMWSSIFNRMTAMSVTYISVGIFTLGTILTPAIMAKVLQVKLSSAIISVLNALSPFWILLKKISESNLSDKIFIIPLWLFPILVYLLISVIGIIVAFMALQKTK
ncbi:MAG: hypothetical protein AAB116_24190 [Candidatus Poribacteria bacterium]